MTKIDILSSINGRHLINNLFRIIRFERQRSSIATLFIMWRICISNVSITNSLISYYLKENTQILYKLGFIKGTIIWLEEIVNRYYFSFISAFVYFGAAVVLVLAGLNRFSDIVDDHIVLYGFSFEAAMLVFIFIIMLFSPNDDVNNYSVENNEDSLEKELLNEIGEISKDFAITSTQLDKIANHLFTIIDKQNQLADTLKNVTYKFADIQNPNPKVVETMQETTNELLKFNSQLTQFIDATNKLKQEEISIAVRKELEKIVSQRIGNS
ncbi:MAG: hypothetical protein FWG85_01310 [Bacteroidetes bacterium]|nr:hypothetical protein [Bacteroidota bacterium]